MIRPGHILVLTAYVQKPPYKPPYDYLVGLGLMFCLNIYLHPSFMNASRKGSGFDTMHLGGSGSLYILKGHRSYFPNMLFLSLKMVFV